MTKNKVICIVSNYDKDDDARAIVNSISCTTLVVDSSGKNKRDFHSTDDPYYAGCFNKSCQLFLDSDATHCLFVCSDIKGNLQAVVHRIENLSENIGVYSPAVLGRGWLHEKPQKYGLREVPFCEGMIWSAPKSVIREVYPEDALANQHGFGFDMHTAYVARVILGKRVVIDDDLNVYHPFGTSYDEAQGRRDMLPYTNRKGSAYAQWFQQNILFLPYS